MFMILKSVTILSARIDRGHREAAELNLGNFGTCSVGR